VIDKALAGTSRMTQNLRVEADESIRAVREDGHGGYWITYYEKARKQSTMRRIPLGALQEVIAVDPVPHLQKVIKEISGLYQDMSPHHRQTATPHQAGIVKMKLDELCNRFDRLSRIAMDIPKQGERMLAQQYDETVRIVKAWCEWASVEPAERSDYPLSE